MGNRAVDIDDVLLNTMGGLVGILLFVIYKKLILNNVNTKVFTSI
ncbi:VanZ family protein [Halalkalibacter urbisdiaboli]